MNCFAARNVFSTFSVGLQPELAERFRFPLSRMETKTKIQQTHFSSCAISMWRITPVEES